MSDLARRLISENKRSRATSLDLGNCGLGEIPKEVSELVWLESLSFASVRYEYAELGWTEVRSQNVGDAKARISDLTPLGRMTQLRSLWLADTGVTDVAPLGGLVLLQVLDLSSNEVEDLSPLASLTALRSLDLSNTSVASLKPLNVLRQLRSLVASGTRVADLAPLASLAELELLFIASTQVAHLWPIASVAALRSLNVARTRIANLEPLATLTLLRDLNAYDTRVADLAPLARLTSLQRLSVKKTDVVNAAPLAALTSLEFVAIGDTGIADISPLASLRSLHTIDISQTKVSDLSALHHHIGGGLAVKWSGTHWDGPGVYVEDCPLVTPPTEIVKQGSAAILNYFRERESGGIDHLYEAKLLILGEGGCGKTSLLRRLYQPERPLPTEQETTRGIDIHRHHFPLKNGRSFRLNVWDFGGQEIYHATHQFFLTHRSLYLLLDDTRKDDKSAADPGFKYWLDVIDLFSDHSPVLIFQNEKGGRSKAIDLAGIKSRYDNVKESYAGNLEHAGAADALRAAIEFHVSRLGHIGEELPARWIQVRAELEERATKVPHISQRDYFAIYGRHLEFDETKALHLSRYLHDLGVFLHFHGDALLARTVFLQNNWVTEAVYRILDDEKVKRARGRFADEDTKRLWHDSGYGEMQPELLALMRRFELCYVLPDTNPPVSLAPQLLPPARPPELASWGKPEDMVLRYRYDVLPKGVVSRLTVRLHRYVRAPELAWTTGVLFESDGTSVLVQVLETGSEVELRARGEDRKALLSVVAADLDALNDSFPGLRDRVDKRIPCNCKGCRTAALPQFFSEKALRKRKEDGRLRVECSESYEDVDVLELLDGIRVASLPGWANGETMPIAQRTIRIFLASSSELREDRDAFELYFRTLNDQFRTEGVYLEVVRWENFLDAISETRLQDEYNRKLEECDVFVSLFFTKTGKFTEEEFDAAHHRFMATKKPRIYTFFKTDKVEMDRIPREDLQSLWAFQDKLRGLGHFQTKYESIEHLKRQFRDQLDKLLE